MEIRETKSQQTISINLHPVISLMCVILLVMLIVAVGKYIVS